MAFHAQMATDHVRNPCRRVELELVKGVWVHDPRPRWAAMQRYRFADTPERVSNGKRGARPRPRRYLMGWTRLGEGGR